MEGKKDQSHSGVLSLSHNCEGCLDPQSVCVYLLRYGVCKGACIYVRCLECANELINTIKHELREYDLPQVFTYTNGGECMFQLPFKSSLAPALEAYPEMHGSQVNSIMVITVHHCVIRHLLVAASLSFSCLQSNNLTSC